MKSRELLMIASILVLTVNSGAQIKLHNNGGISIGSTTDPLSEKAVFAIPVDFSSPVTINSTVDLNEQIKLHNSGGISIGSSADPGSEKTVFADPSEFSSSATFSNAVIFDQPVTFNNGSNIFERYNGAGGIKILGTGGTLSMYPDQDLYKINTTEDRFYFEDKVQFIDGIAVSPGGPADFYSTSTFNSTVNLGQVGTTNTTNIYGNLTLHSANSSAAFTCHMPSEITNGLDVYNYLTIYGYFYNYCDVNLKTNIKDIGSEALARITQLQGVTYNFKIDEPDETPRSGFIAQDLQKVFPDLVVEGKEGLAIKSLELIPYLVEALKEQQKRINDLERSIIELTKPNLP